LSEEERRVKEGGKGLREVVGRGEGRTSGGRSVGIVLRGLRPRSLVFS
jgi:hypothetical protein